MNDKNMDLSQARNLFLCVLFWKRASVNWFWSGCCFVPVVEKLL